MSDHAYMRMRMQIFRLGTRPGVLGRDPAPAMPIYSGDENIMLDDRFTKLCMTGNCDVDS